MNKNYYTTLGITKGATKDDIKKAFHKLARKYHPDNTSTGDEQRFKEINEAYQTLSNEQKRAEYDTYGHVFSGGARGGTEGFSGASPFGDFSQDFEFDIGDIFNDFFGGGGRSRRGRDISIDLEISFKESIFGTTRSVLVTKTAKCDICQGTGAKRDTELLKCKTCNGQGKLHETRNSFLGSFASVRECGTCTGRGTTPKQKCTTCHGLGIVKKQEEINIHIPHGIQNGEVVRLSGMGEAVLGGASGDFYVKVHVTPHSVFRREGNNLLMSLDIKLTDALLGGEYSVELLNDTKITLKVPPTVSIGEILRVKGKGIPFEKGKAGDLLVKLNIKLPKNLSRKAKKLFKELEDEGI